MDKDKTKNQLPAPPVEDEEFADKIYDEMAQPAPQFQQEHEISITGAELRPGTPSGTDAPPPEDD